MLDDLIQNLHLRNWYAVAALALTLGVQIFRKAPWSSKLWAGIPNGYRWLIPVLSGAVTGFTQAFAANLPIGAAILAAIGGAIGISIPAMGLNSLLTESPVKWNGGAGGAPPKDNGPKRPPFVVGGAGLLLALGLAFHASACSPAHNAADVPRDVAIAYASANAALEIADTAESAYLDSLANPTQDQLDHAAAVVAKLQQVRAALVAVHDDFANGRAKLKEALVDLQAGIELANTLGVKVPDKVTKALAAASEALK